MFLENKLFHNAHFLSTRIAGFKRNTNYSDEIINYRWRVLLLAFRTHYRMGGTISATAFTTSTTTTLQQKLKQQKQQKQQQQQQETETCSGSYLHNFLLFASPFSFIITESLLMLTHLSDCLLLIKNMSLFGR
jgi:hypothetical protein